MSSNDFSQNISIQNIPIQPQGNFGRFYNQEESALDVWFKNLANLKRFILGHNRRPSSVSEDLEEKRLACWERNQLANSKHGVRRGIMMHDEVFKAWDEFLSS